MTALDSFFSKEQRMLAMLVSLTQCVQHSGSWNLTVFSVTLLFEAECVQSALAKKQIFHTLYYSRHTLPLGTLILCPLIILDDVLKLFLLNSINATLASAISYSTKGSFNRTSPPSLQIIHDPSAESNISQPVTRTRPTPVQYIKFSLFISMRNRSTLLH